MATTYKVVRKALGKRTLPPAVDKLADFVGKQVQGSLGWFEGLTIEAPSGTWAQRIPEKLRADGVVIALLPDGERIVLVRAGEQTPVLLVHVDGGARLVAPSIEAFAAAWATGTSGIPAFDHDGSRVVERHGRSAATTRSVPSARKALKAWMRAQRIKPKRGEVFDLDGYLGAKTQASDGTIPSAPRSLHPGLIDGKRSAFAEYADLLAIHPIADVIAADVAALAEPKGKRTAKLHARETFLAYVKHHLAPRYARIASNMTHYTEPAFPKGMGFRYGFLEELDTFSWTPAMLEQVPALLADDHARWARRITPRGLTFTELDVFGSMRALRRLEFRWSKIGAVKSMAPLAELRALVALDVQGSAITDLSPLRKLPIVQLKAMQTPLVDLSPLANHPTLENIDLGGTRVSDVRPLMTCPRLVKVSLWDAKVSDGDAAALVAAMKKRKARPTSNQTYLIDGYDRGVTHNNVMWV